MQGWGGSDWPMEQWTPFPSPPSRKTGSSHLESNLFPHNGGGYREEKGPTWSMTDADVSSKQLRRLEVIQNTNWH